MVNAQITLSGWTSPLTHDVLGMVLHFATIVVIFSVDKWYTRFFDGNKVGPALLVGQEGVALVAHVTYTALRLNGHLADNQRNPWKWLEYSISATMGTIAALTINETSPEWHWILFLALTGAGQQFIGYQIDLDAPIELDSEELIFASARSTPRKFAVNSKILISFVLAVVLQVRRASASGKSQPQTDA